MKSCSCLALLLCVLMLCACGTPAPADQPGGTAAVRVVGPEGAELLNQQVEFTGGETVLDVLLRVAEARSVHVEVAGGASAYVTAIGDVSAQSNSGWVYTVNGASPTVGADQQPLSDGDAVEWSFVEF